jgi:hypothetical protein
MRNVKPQMAGAASAVMNTLRQLGGAVGSAVVGAVLQNRLATNLHDQAVGYASTLPPQARQPFVKAFSSTGSGGLEVGRQSSSAAGQSLAGLPPQAAHQIAQVAHDVFRYGFIYAMRPTLAVPIAGLVLGAVSCLAIRRRRRPDGAVAESARPEEAAVHAA